MMATLFIIYIIVRCRMQPHLGPTISKEERDIPMSEKLKLLRAGIIPFLIFFLMTGLFVMGVTSLVESSAVGATTATIAATRAALSHCRRRAEASGFFALRRIVIAAVARMDADNDRLERLLATARTLSRRPHEDEIARTTADCALVLTAANASFVMLHGDKDEEPSCASSAGRDAEGLFEQLEVELAELAEGAIAARQVTQLSFDRGDQDVAQHGSAVAVPLCGESEIRGAFVVLRVGDRSAPCESEPIDRLESLAAFAAVALDNADLQLTQRNFFAHVTDLLVMALDAHVDRRSGHATKVAEYAYRVGRELGLADERLRRLHFAALLHDLGMLKVAPEHQRIRAHFEKHPITGARMLSPIRMWREAAPIVMHHHEHYDGSGYPAGLIGEAIPLESRIILVVDAFDAMVRDDDHRPARPFGEAADELRAGMGTQFDPDIVTAFLGLVQRGEIEVRA